MASMICRPGIGWEPLDGEPLWLANGQDFQHWIDVAEPWPVGTTSYIEIDDVVGHFVDGVLSADRLTFSYRVEAPGGNDTAVADRARYRIWVVVPNSETSTSDNWKWFVGEVRRKDE